MPELVQGLGLGAFQQRWPWIGPDLQTLRDTLKPPLLPPDQGEPLALAVGDQASLLAMGGWGDPVSVRVSGAWA